MVRALLDGTKTQTRRVVKPQPDSISPDGIPARFFHQRAIGSGYPVQIRCPYGQPGDRLWVREAIRLVPDQEPDDGTGRVLSTYGADGSLTVADAWPWKRSYLPPMHCPRGLSRIDLEITDVRVERLQDISEADAIAEGITGPHNVGYPAYRMPDDSKPRYSRASAAYEALWEQINGPDSWALNPWVWVVEFRRAQP